MTASTGVDALCHVLECYTSKKANPFSDLIALEGIRLITGSIRTAFKNGEDISARSNMLLGSFYGGVSIGSSSTTAVHALSYPLGGKYRIPHGVANAMLLVPVMEFNRDAISEKLTAAAKVAGIHSSSKDADLSVEFIRFLKELVKELQIPSSLSAFGIKSEAIPELTENALQVTRLLSNNPKPMSASDIKAIYETIR
ncbi:MAG: iron-containing alcohol dehydrogenase [Spirochaetales bacterium]|nr:iron-containing alcohol dehydrogenase [Spirochaetales bacterium]